MPRNAFLCVLVLLVTALAGCQDPGMINGDERQCIAETCTPDTQSQDYLYALNEYGLHQVSDSPKEEWGPLIEGDLISWQTTRIENGVYVSDILGWDVAKRELIDVGVSGCHHQTLNYQSGGRVVFVQEPATDCAPDYPSRQYMVVWDHESRESRVIEDGLGGKPFPKAFDGSWVVFMIRGSTNESENGYWAHNVDDGRQMFLHAIYPGNKKPDGSYETVHDASVSQESAFINIFKASEEEDGPVSAVIEEHNLESGESVEVVNMPGWQFNRMDASERYVVWTAIEADYNLGVYDRLTQEAWIADNAESAHVSFPRTGGNWAVFDYNLPDAGSPIYGYHIPSRTMHELIPDDDDVGSQTTDTDGTRLVAKLFRMSNRHFDTTGVDVYWMDLPEVAE